MLKNNNNEVKNKKNPCTIHNNQEILSYLKKKKTEYLHLFS